MVRIVNERAPVGFDNRDGPPSAGANQGANGRPGGDAEGIMRNDPQCWAIAKLNILDTSAFTRFAWMGAPRAIIPSGRAITRPETLRGAT